MEAATFHRRLTFELNIGWPLFALAGYALIMVSFNGVIVLFRNAVPADDETDMLANVARFDNEFVSFFGCIWIFV